MNTNTTQPSEGSKEGDSSLPRIPKKKEFTSVQDSSAAAAASSSVTAAMHTNEPTKNEGGNTKMENDKTEEDTVSNNTTSPPKRKPGRPPKDKSPTPAKVSAVVAPKSLEGFDPPILRKGDLVRLSNE